MWKICSLPETKGFIQKALPESLSRVTCHHRLVIFSLESFAADMSHISLHTGQQKTQIRFSAVKANGKGGGVSGTEMGKRSVWGKKELW